MSADIAELLKRLEELKHFAELVADDGSVPNVIDWLSRWLRLLLTETKGYTVRWDGTPITNGHAVAVKWPCHVGVALSTSEIYTFYAEHQEFMQMHGLVPGGWTDDKSGQEMLLCTKVFQSQEEANAFGLSEKQRFGWNLGEKAPWPVEP